MCIYIYMYMYICIYIYIYICIYMLESEIHMQPAAHRPSRTETGPLGQRAHRQSQTSTNDMYVHKGTRLPHASKTHHKGIPTFTSRQEVLNREARAALLHVLIILRHTLLPHHRMLSLLVGLIALYTRSTRLLQRRKDCLK